MRKPPYVPPTISPEAQTLIKHYQPGERPMAAQSIAKIRQVNWETCKVHSKAAADKFLDQITESTIADTKCLFLTPKEYSEINDHKIILYFFGGGHVIGGPFEDLPISAKLSSASGVKVIAPFYSLAPEKPFPSALNEAYRIYQQLLKDYGAENIIVTGESAGSNLALALMQKLYQNKSCLPAAVALLSPWADLTHVNESMNLHILTDPTYADECSLDLEANAYVNKHDKSNPLISPLFGHYDETFPPILLTTGTRDILMSDCAILSTKLRQANVDCRLHLWEGLWHVFEYYPDIPEGQKSLEEIAKFIKEFL